MARLPSKLLTLPVYLRQRFGISRRTFERWCVHRDVPGAYRTRGGHWRVRKLAWATVKRLWLHSHKPRTRRERVLRAICDYPSFFSLPDPKAQLAARKLMLACYEITDDDIRDPNLQERDPEKYQVLWEISPPPSIPRWVWEAVNDSKRAPAIAASMMRLNGSKVTRATLARELRVSMATLYRRYGKEKIGKICSADTEIELKHSAF